MDKIKKCDLSELFRKSQDCSKRISTLISEFYDSVSEINDLAYGLLNRTSGKESMLDKFLLNVVRTTDTEAIMQVLNGMHYTLQVMVTVGNDGTPGLSLYNANWFDCEAIEENFAYVDGREDTYFVNGLPTRIDNVSIAQPDGTLIQAKTEKDVSSCNWENLYVIPFEYDENGYVYEFDKDGNIVD